MPSTFIPGELDCTRFENIEPYITQLLKRPVSSPADLERWLIDRSELSAACSETKANLYISMTCDTDDAAAQTAFASFIENVDPKLTPAAFELDKRLVELAARHPLNPARYAVLERSAKADVELFRPENVPLETELSRLDQQTEQLAGSLTVNFEGEEKTLPQMARYQEVTDRAKREAAWRATAERRLREVDNFNSIYDQMIRLRDQVGRNAGFPNYIGYAYKSKHRFDYGVEACERFHAGVEAAVVPLMRELERQRAGLLKVSPLRPWDLAVDVKGRAPLRPFEGGRDLMRKAVGSLERLDPRLAKMFAALGDGSEARGSRSGACLDLDTRKGKAPGGYQYQRERARKCFIFMNAAGMHRDVETMVHEAGHALHSMLCVDEPLIEYRQPPMEFAEVASMSMELLSMRHWTGAANSFYPAREDFNRACRDQLKHSVLLLPWIATIDAFQHWVYGNPTHSRADRAAHWLSLDARFGSSVSWEGLEQYRPWIWQRQMHLYGHPFYYIEYGIAQLGALQLWLRSLEEGETTAVEAYMKALSLGGSKPLPDLFAAAGLKFDFGPDVVKRLVERVTKELERVPE